VKCKDLALLAPVPIMHLKSAQEDGLQKVAFGSNVYEVFHKVEQQRHNFPVDIYIYASWTHTDMDCEKITPPSATWKGEYIGWIDARRRNDYLQYRPKSTHGETDWGFFWLVQNLHRLDKPIAIELFRGLEQKKYYKHDFIPKHPYLVEYQ
jgi:hypothetical protein